MLLPFDALGLLVSPNLLVPSNLGAALAYSRAIASRIASSVSSSPSTLPIFSSRAASTSRFKALPAADSWRTAFFFASDRTGSPPSAERRRYSLIDSPACSALRRRFFFSFGLSRSPWFSVRRSSGGFGGRPGPLLLFSSLLICRGRCVGVRGWCVRSFDIIQKEPSPGRRSWGHWRLAFSGALCAGSRRLLWQGSQFMRPDNVACFGCHSPAWVIYEGAASFPTDAPAQRQEASLETAKRRAWTTPRLINTVSWSGPSHIRSSRVLLVITVSLAVALLLPSRFSMLPGGGPSKLLRCEVLGCKMLAGAPVASALAARVQPGTSARRERATRQEAVNRRQPKTGDS